MKICNDAVRILIALKESAGDIFLITGTIDSLKKKYPESTIYVACEKKFWNILEGNPSIKGLLEFHDSMYNYRAYTKWAMNNNPFDIVYAPAIQTQVVPGNWLNGKYAVHLAKFYANACNVELGHTFIEEVPTERFNLPSKYVTVQGQSGQDPKNYDYMQRIVDKIKLPVVQIGGKDDSELQNVIDLRGKTTFKEGASVIKKASMHLGLDSVLMHFAAHFNVPSVILFGGTLPEAAVNPDFSHIHVVETQDRGPCLTSCHLVECEAKKQGYSKCINNISVDQILDTCAKILDKEDIEPLEEIKISSYLIIRDGIKYGFPFEEAIRAARKVSDEVVVVDGGSTDGTFEKLQQLQTSFHLMSDTPCQIVVEQHEWDMNCPTLFGDEKTYAKELCTGTHCIQLDADEIISEPYEGAIRDLIKKNRLDDVLDLPCINFYGDTETIRIEQNFWKWRISRNDTNIIHGVHKAARQMDAETAQLTMDKRLSDSCEIIYDDTLNICKHKFVFDVKALEAHEKIKRGLISQEEYLLILNEIIKSSPVIFHYSWLDLNRKENNGSFWDNTYHGKRKATHNTTDNITNRVAQKDKEMLLKVNFNHPLKEKYERTK